MNIIDQCVAQGVPFGREYGGLLGNRSFGGAQVSRTFYARGQTGQQLLLGAYQALERQIGLGKVAMYPRHEMLELVVVDGRARGIVTRDMVTGAIESYVADAVILATGGYGNVFYLSTNATGCNTTAIWRAYKKGAAFGNPCYTQIHPTCIPVTGDHQSKLTLMSESLRNDGRIWVPLKKGETRPPGQIPEAERDYYLERKYPSYGNLAPRDIASRAAKQVCDEGRGVGETHYGVYLDFADAIKRLGEDVIRDRYGNLFDMYERITDENPYKVPMRIYPASHYTMGGLWVDYNLMSTIPGLHVAGEANFSDHGANRLGASALMQGLADGYFVLPYTIGNFLAGVKKDAVDTKHAAFKDAENAVGARIKKLLAVKGKRTVDSFSKELGKIMWEYCGMARNKAGLETALKKIPALREEFWKNVTVAGAARGAEPVARAGGPRGRLPRARRAHVPRRARPRGVLRRAFPRGVPDAGRRGRPQRREVLPRGGLGIHGRGQGAGAARRAARVPGRPPRHEELQVKLTLNVWRQKDAKSEGRFVTYDAPDISPDMSFLEMLDIVNERLILKGEDPIAFDHDCREGICGMCSIVVNGNPHGPRRGTTACQLHMRSFKDGDTITLEPWRATPFPIVKDLIVDRSSFDRIIAAGGFVSVSTGSAPDGNAIPIPRRAVRTAPWTRPPASAAAPAWRPARTPRRCSSSRPRSRTSLSSRRASPSATSASSRWSRRWTPRASARARTTASARAPARRRSSRSSSRSSTATSSRRRS